MAKNRNDFTAPNMSIETPHKAVPIPHPTPRNRLFTPPKKQKKMACSVRLSEDLETGRLKEDDLLSIPRVNPSLVSLPHPHTHGLEKCSAVPVNLDFLRVDRWLISVETG